MTIRVILSRPRTNSQLPTLDYIGIGLKSNSQIWTIPSPTINSEIKKRILLDYLLTPKRVLYWCVFRSADRILGPCRLRMTVLLFQEARKEGFFAALSCGLASGEHPSCHEASRVVMWIFMHSLPRSYRSLSIRLILRSAVIGSRLFGFKRNVSFFCGARE